MPSYERDMDPNKKVTIAFLKGLHSKSGRKTFKNWAAYEKWQNSEVAGDYTILQVFNENITSLTESKSKSKGVRSSKNFAAAAHSMRGGAGAGKHKDDNTRAAYKGHERPKNERAKKNLYDRTEATIERIGNFTFLSLQGMQDGRSAKEILRDEAPTLGLSESEIVLHGEQILTLSGGEIGQLFLGEDTYEFSLNEERHIDQSGLNKNTGIWSDTIVADLSIPALIVAGRATTAEEVPFDLDMEVIDSAIENRSSAKQMSISDQKKLISDANALMSGKGSEIRVQHHPKNGWSWKLV